jgi:hypothetical protein
MPPTALIAGGTVGIVLRHVDQCIFDTVVSHRRKLERGVDSLARGERHRPAHVL